MEDQGVMTSPALRRVLEATVARSYPEIATGGRDKVAILQAVLDAHGWRPVLELGLMLRTLSAHPVLRALGAGATPWHTMERWQTLERFLHSRHRTRFVERDASLTRMTLQHVAIDGGRIRAVNDLFIWGVLIAVLESAGFTGITVSLASTEGRSVVIHGGRGPKVLPAKTDVATFAWKSPRDVPVRESPAPGEESRSVRDRLQKLMSVDLLHPWTLEECAQRLILSRRGLQRALQSEGTTFSATLQRTRVEAAHALLGEPELTLTDVAFCTGFADQAHFSRTFRKFNEVPPSALRGLLR